MGIGADLRMGSNVKLCQNVTIASGTEYILGLDMLGDQVVEFSIVNSSVNGIEIGLYNVSSIE